MEQLPKIAQRRLQENQKSGVHPDPDLLAAFTEKTLNDRERSHVLQHLAVCADCREVVSLAMPPIESSPMPIAKKSGWLSWPTLRWSALAAAVVVVSAAITLRYEHRQVEESSVAGKAPASLTAQNDISQQAPKVATKIPPPGPFQSDRNFGLEGKLAKQRDDRIDAVTAPRAQLSAPPKAEEKTEEKKDATGVRANAFAMKSADKASSADEIIVAGVPPASPAAKPTQASSGSEARETRDEPFPSAMTETVTVQSAAPAIQTSQSSEPKAKDASAGNESQKETQAAAPGAGGTATGDHRLDALSSAMTQVAVGGNAKRSRLGHTVPRWTLSADGVLQRSFDSGKTWQTIAVANNVVFRALAANDSDIWVGGAAGMLYHSSDAGQHWLKVNAVAGGQPLTADIVTLEFSDPQDGKLTTANRELWTTNDAGNTWQKQ
jgi:hypothetical protein